MTIDERLDDLIKQAEEERSHHYVAATARAALYEINKLRDEKADLVSFLRGISRQTAAMAKSYEALPTKTDDRDGSQRPGKKR